MSQQQSDIEGVWEELVGDAITPLPPPPEFAGAVDEEMQSRASARLPLHVVPLSGPDSDAVPIEVIDRPKVPLATRTPVPAAPRTVRRPQSEADAMAAPQSEIADAIVALEVGGQRRRRLPPTLRTRLLPPEDELDVVLVNVTQTGPHATLPADEIVELDVADLDLEDSHPDGRSVIEVDLIDELEEDDDSIVAGEIDLADPEALPRGGTEAARAMTRSTAIANAMRGATVRARIVPERKVKTKLVSISRASPAKATTVRTEVVQLTAAKPTTVKTVAVHDHAPPGLVGVAAVEAAAVEAAAVEPSVAAVPAASSSAAMFASDAFRRGAFASGTFARDEGTTPKPRTMAWVAGAIGLALVGIVALAVGGEDTKPTSQAAIAESGVVESPVVPSATAPVVVDHGPERLVEAPMITPPGGSPRPSAAEPAIESPTIDAAPADETHRVAGAAYVAAVERYETEHSNAAVEEMVLAACAMDDGPRARSAFRKLRGADPRKRTMIACRDRNIDLWARVDGPTAGELLVVAKRQLAEGDVVHALESARESNHVSRSNGALLVMGISLCRLGRAAEAEALERHLPPRLREELRTICAG